MSDDKIKSSTSYLVVVGPGGQATIHHADGRVHELTLDDWDACSPEEEVAECALLLTTG